VLKRQYLLADASIEQFIVKTIQKSQAVRDAVCLLASLHQQSRRRIASVPSPPSADDDSTYMRICRTLQREYPGKYTEDEALTGLLVVSAFLFRGGRGAWAQFLNVATQWVQTVLEFSKDPADALLTVSDSQRFIIKTTFWFDILAATTNVNSPPRFLATYRQLWGPGSRSAYIGPAPTGGSQQPELGMLDVMGADNATALALAETANLAVWKERRVRQADLSVLELVDRAKRIEAEYLAAPSPTIPPATLYGAQEEDLSVRRRLTANIFRATAKVYLHSVVSGDYPQVPEIRSSVNETLSCLRQIPASRSALSSSVLRSVVFGICLCGCLTDDYDERQILLRRLEEEQEEGVGNCEEAKKVMECVWAKREEARGAAGNVAVDWRQVINDLGGGESLLLV
jgi:C6 transcription factor Pro1